MDARPVSASVSASSPVMAFRSSEPAAFPWAGATLLAMLTIVAVVAKWRSRSSGSLPSFSWFRGRGRHESPLAWDDPELAVEQRLRLADGTQLHVIRWANRQVLVATTAHAAPVALDRLDKASPTPKVVP